MRMPGSGTVVLACVLGWGLAAAGLAYGGAALIQVTADLLYLLLLPVTQALTLGMLGGLVARWRGRTLDSRSVVPVLVLALVEAVWITQAVLDRVVGDFKVGLLSFGGLPVMLLTAFGGLCLGLGQRLEGDLASRGSAGMHGSPGLPPGRTILLLYPAAIAPAGLLIALGAMRHLLPGSTDGLGAFLFIMVNALTLLGVGALAKTRRGHGLRPGEFVALCLVLPFAESFSLAYAFQIDTGSWLPPVPLMPFILVAASTLTLGLACCLGWAEAVLKLLPVRPGQ